MSTWMERKRKLIRNAAAKRKAQHPRMTDDQYRALVAKIAREFPVRVKLAKLLGTTKLIGSPLGGESLGDLYLHIVLWNPDKASEALRLIAPVWSFSQEPDDLST